MDVTASRTRNRPRSPQSFRFSPASDDRDRACYNVEEGYVESGVPERDADVASSVASVGSVASSQTVSSKRLTVSALLQQVAHVATPRKVRVDSAMVEMAELWLV
jgi:hypothetical protein